LPRTRWDVGPRPGFRTEGIGGKALFLSGLIKTIYFLNATMISNTRAKGLQAYGVEPKLRALRLRK